MASRQRWWRGLLARVTLIYAFGALGLSATVALSSFALAQNRLLSEVEEQHRRQAYRNMLDVRTRLSALGPLDETAGGLPPGGEEAAALIEQGATSTTTAPPTSSTTTTRSAGFGDATTSSTASEDVETTDVPVPDEEALENLRDSDVYLNLLGDLRRSNNSRSGLLLPTNEFRSFSLEIGDVPIELRSIRSTNDDNPIQFRYRDGNGAHYALAVYFEDVDAAYFEILPLADIESTLSSLRLILAGVAVAASLAGALLGYYSARVALSPLPRISNRARAIAEGDFSTKLELRDEDRDLAILTDAFNDMIDAVRERIERERRFTTDVSHELRSPLMTVAASVEVLERRKESLPDVAQQAIDLLSHDLQRFQRLVEDLLEVSRMEAGAVQLQLSRFRLSEFLENVIYQSRAPHLELICDPADTQTSITADKRRLAQVVTNLLDNAEKYGNGATGVQFDVVGENVQIVIDDSGPGVPAEHRDRIFERFGRIEAGNRAAAGGFGLGLALVAEHVRIHGGQVWVTDRIDGERGARFVVQLPLGEHIDVVEEMAV